jgi:hypothetical protein
MRQQFRGRIAIKCASAFAAMTVIVLGTPAIALASTVGSGSGPAPGPGGQVQIVCTVGPGQQLSTRVVRIRAKVGRIAPGVIRLKLHGRPPRGFLACPFPRACPPLTFDMAPGSSTLTEVSGPVLAPPEEFSYQGQTYTIMSVNPGAGSFTVFRDGALFVNQGPAITRGIGLMTCAPRIVRYQKNLT